LIVGEVAIVGMPGDALADAVAQRVISRGRRAIMLSVPEAAEFFTVELDGLGARVTPDLPVFVAPLSARGGADVGDSDADFHESERLGALWAAAALMRSPVINRPGQFGFSGRCASSSASTALSCGEFDGRSELYFRGTPACARITSEWVEDIERYQMTAGSSRDPGTYRSRDTTRVSGYYPVAVVGERCFPCLVDDARLNTVADRSIDAVRKLELSFAVLFWGILAGDEAVLSAVFPWPNLVQLGASRDIVIESLAGLLCDPS
jgi:hypothetical protein